MAQGLSSQHQHTDEGCKATDRHLSLAGAPSGISNHCRDNGIGNDIGGRTGEGAAVGPLDDVALAAVDNSGDVGFFSLFAIFDLDDANAVEVFHQGG